MPLLPGISPGNVDGRQGCIEGKCQGLLVAGPRTAIEILQVHVVTEAAYDVEAQLLDSGNEALLGEVGIRHDEIAAGLAVE